jgi:hypothetical protein
MAFFFSKRKLGTVYPTPMEELLSTTTSEISLKKAFAAES